MSVTPSDLARTLVCRASARRDADQSEGDRCRRELTLALPHLRRELGFERAWLIGSLAWGGFGIRSDVDVVVDGASSEALGMIAERLGEITGRVVDVIALDVLPPSFRERVLADGLHVT